jgi:hypothetical protein
MHVKSFAIMGQRLKDHADVLRRLMKGSSKQRYRILGDASPDLIKCLCECADNTLNSNIPLNEAQLQKLRRHKKTVRALACKKTTLRTKKRRLINQSGGFLLPLLEPIVSALLTELLF